jgi:hypothetical protein
MSPGLARDTFCEECRRRTLELASATVEAVVIQRDIVARTSSGQEVSQRLRFWLDEVQAGRARILQALHEHRNADSARARNSVE